MADSIDRIGGARSTLGMKAPARVATTANVTLSGLQTIDGVTLAEGDRILVKNQTDTRLNGIRIASTGAWARAVDWDGNTDVVQGVQVYVANGTVGTGTYILTTANPISIGTSNIVFADAAGGSATGYLDLNEISVPPLPPVNTARIYAYDDGGLTRVAIEDSSGNITFIGAGSADFNFEHYR